MNKQEPRLKTPLRGERRGETSIRPPVKASDFSAGVFLRKKEARVGGEDLVGGGGAIPLLSKEKRRKMKFAAHRLEPGEKPLRSGSNAS